MADRNYLAHGGKEFVIGGKLTFLPGAVVEGLDEVLDTKYRRYKPPDIPDSKATTIAALRNDYNRLLASLRDAGVLAPIVDETVTEAADVSDD